jgi:hypothetical protein
MLLQPCEQAQDVFGILIMSLIKKNFFADVYLKAIPRPLRFHYNLTNVNENKNLEDYYTYNDDINEDSNVSLVISTFPLAISEDEFAKSS